jgi:AraC-like DNA-binding protein
MRRARRVSICTISSRRPTPRARGMHYFEFDPAPPLAAHVSCYWGMSVGMQVPRNHPHQILPDGCITIACNRAASGELRASLVGPRAEPMIVPVSPGDRFWGVRFWPDAGGAVLGVNPRKLHGHVVAPLSEPAWAVALTRALGSCADEAAATRVADQQLAAPVAAAQPLDPIVRAAVLGLVATNGEMEIGELARGVGLGLRQVERRFGAAVGLNPKQFALIRRMRSALAHLLGPTPKTWSEVAADLGYADHALLVRDFALLAGSTPTEIADRVRAIVQGKVRP